jgi:branched-chain amino acid transport system ATP-binding protein
VLEVQRLEVRYGAVEAVRGLSVQATSGRVTLMLGTNGAGKTTTLRTISGFLKPHAGRVFYDGQDVTGLPPHKLVRRGLILVPEGRRIFAPLTVEQNLRMGAYTAPKSKFDAAIARVYEMFPILYERRKGPAGLLSGGEQQMLAFGRGLMSEPRVVLMDEPSMGLAPMMVEVVLSSVRTIADSGIGVLVVEQNAEVGLEVADDVIIISRGQAVFSGAAEEARSSASVISAFLGDASLGGDARVLSGGADE